MSQRSRRCRQDGEPRQRGRRAAAVGAICLVAVVATMPRVMPVTAAFAQNCTPAPYGDVCTQEIGGSHGHYVDTTRVTRDKVSGAMICNYSATVTISGVSQVFRSPTHNGCTPVEAWFDFHLSRNLPNNTTLCGRFFESGTQQGGAACQQVFEVPPPPPKTPQPSPQPPPPPRR